jgi:translation initiation factor IF-2
MEKSGYIYILTNPSFPEYVKIGYADDVEKRLEQLNRSECVPFAFKVYATYRVSTRLTDVKVHDIIDKLNPGLRAIEEYNGKKRVREFYAMSAQDAYSLLEAIAAINGLEGNLKKTEQTLQDEEDEREAEQIRKRAVLPKMDWLIEQGIVKIGDELYVKNHPAEIAKVVDTENVDYKGTVMSFNQFILKVTGWKTAQTYAQLVLVGHDESLADFREKRMIELGME